MGAKGDFAPILNLKIIYKYHAVSKETWVQLFVSREKTAPVVGLKSHYMTGGKLWICKNFKCC